MIMDEQKRKDIEKKARYECKKAQDEFLSDMLHATVDDFKKVYGPQGRAYDAIMKAVDDYWADIARRKAALDKQAAEYDERIVQLQEALDDLENQSRTAASIMDLDAAAAYDEQADPIRAELEAVQRKRRIIDSTDLKGDPEIYQRLEDAQERYDLVRPICEQARAEAYSALRNAADQLNTLANMTAYLSAQTYDALHPEHDYSGRKVYDVTQHFHGAPTYEEQKKLESDKRHQDMKSRGIIWYEGV